MPAIEVGTAALVIAGWAVTAFCVYVGLLLRRTGQIRGDIAAGIGKLEARVDAREKQLAELEERIDAKISQIPDPADIEIPDIDYEAIAQVVGRHVEMQFRQIEAQQAKRTGQFLKDMGIDEALGDLEAGAREEAMAALGPQAQVAMEILNTKIPKKASLIEKTVMQFAKAQAAQLVQGQMAGLQGAAVEAPKEVSRGFGVR